jgi:uncharacterized glyoxalase superfamily protein PhnB
VAPRWVSYDHSEHHCRRRGASRRATENYRLTLSDGTITHCELRIGDSVINLGTAIEGWPAHGLIAQIFVEAPDSLFERAVRAGATATMPMTDVFFGIREGRVSDPFGNVDNRNAQGAFDPGRDAATTAGGRLLTATFQTVAV